MDVISGLVIVAYALLGVPHMRCACADTHAHAHDPQAQLSNYALSSYSKRAAHDFGVRANC